MRITDTKSRILELMELYQLNQTAFCERTKITKSALSNYLNGDRVPRQEQVSKIADAFHISAAWVMGYDVPMKDETSDKSKIQIVESDIQILIDEYEQLDVWGKSAVLETAHREFERCQVQKQESKNDKTISDHD